MIENLLLKKRAMIFLDKSVPTIILLFFQSPGNYIFFVKMGFACTTLVLKREIIFNLLKTNGKKS